MLKRQMSEDVKQCYVDVKTHPQYRDAATSFTFIINSTNPLLPGGYNRKEIQKYTVDHWSIGKILVVLTSFVLCLPKYILLLFSSFENHLL